MNEDVFSKDMNSTFLQKLALTPSIVLVSVALVLMLAQPSCVSKKVDSDRVISVRDSKGKPFFPLGFYHVSNRLTAQQRMDALQDIAAAGFNTIHAGCSNLGEYSKFLDEADRLGIAVITEFDRNNYEQIVARFRRKPAVLGWSIADDAGDHHTKAQILDLHRKIKAIDPNHYTTISISGWSRKWTEFADAGDLIGGQSYPIGYTLSNPIKGLSNPLIEVNHTFSLASAAATRRNRPFIANVQAFTWQKQRSPTASEVYNMTYQSILAGVKGVLFFAYDDAGENQIRNNPVVWKRLQSIVPEIDRLSPILINGKLTKLDTNNKELIAGQWKYNNRFYAIVVNTSQTKTISTAIPLSIDRGNVTTLFPGNPAGMILENGRLRGSVKPEDVHIYQISQ